MHIYPWYTLWPCEVWYGTPALLVFHCRYPRTPAPIICHINTRLPLHLAVGSTYLDTLYDGALLLQRHLRRICVMIMTMHLQVNNKRATKHQSFMSTNGTNNVSDNFQVSDNFPKNFHGYIFVVTTYNRLRAQTSSIISYWLYFIDIHWQLNDISDKIHKRTSYRIMYTVVN